ncbi:thermonuclease family protein, partial [Acidisphaera sp. L21]|uniref:thermonuclease family protein n=1 Tax=Acidisphaera sp. L21 TaxID=1641851 RepID=UPI001C207DDA
PRRIFRSSSRPAAPRGLLRTVTVALFGAVAGGSLVMLGLSGSLFGQMTSDARVISASPGQVAVIDGDTLRLDGVVVRLSDIKAPRRGQACAAGPDCGMQATAALAELVRDQRVECRVSGHDSLGRPAARCDAGGQDVNAALVMVGWARAETATFSSAEHDARSHRRGLWLTN